MHTIRTRCNMSVNSNDPNWVCGFTLPLCFNSRSRTPPNSALPFGFYGSSHSIANLHVCAGQLVWRRHPHPPPPSRQLLRTTCTQMLPLVEMFCRWELQEDCGNLRELMLRFDSEVELQTHALGRSLLGMIRDADNELEGLPRRPLVDPAPNPFDAVRDKLASVDTALRNLHAQVQIVDLIACRLDCPPRGCFEWPRHVQILRIEISMHLPVLCVHNKYCKILSVSVTFISQFRLCMLHNASKHPGLETTALLLRLSLRLCFKLKCVSSAYIAFFMLLYAQCYAVYTSVMPKFHSPCNKAGTSREGTEIQSDSERDPASRCLRPLELHASDRDPPAAPAPSTGPVLSPESPAGVCSPPLLPSAAPNVPLRVASRGVASIPLHHTERPLPMPFPNVNSTISTLLSCMDMCVLIITMYITSTETSEAHAAHRKKLKKKGWTTCLCHFPTHARDTNPKTKKQISHMESALLTFWHGTLASSMLGGM